MKPSAKPVRKMPSAGASPTAVLAWLRANGTAHQRSEQARYGIVAPRAFGVSVGTLLRLAPSASLRGTCATPSCRPA
jgi:hypothetical protein